jgi:glucosamine--fructose-6-phosphate aminotransferase (isomerizing)
MCGIVGYLGTQNATDILVDGLRRLEYRGYDSAGVAVARHGELVTLRAEGKLDNLVRRLSAEPLNGTTGIGHTRWATHGPPTEANAHPHRSGTLAVVHNGIIENYVVLKRELEALGDRFASQTDTEVIAHLVNHYRTREGLGLVESVRRATARLEGAYALVVMDATEPDVLVGVRLASPLIVGLGTPSGDAPADENFLASDVSAILAHTRRVHFLDEGELAVVRRDGVQLFDIHTNTPRPLKPVTVTWTPAMAEKGGFKHFMLKEIHEQPRAIADTLRGRVSLETLEVQLPELGLDAETVKSWNRIYFLACGTSWHAGMVGRYLFEDLAGLAPHVELASEFRYRHAPVDAKTLIVAISQSGETADTLAAVRDARRRGARVLSICNVIGASIPRESHGTLYTHAGPEIGVASTKAFTTQLVALHLMALHLGQLNGFIDRDTLRNELEGLLHAPALVEAALSIEQPFHEASRRWQDARSMLFLGRGALFPIALEGALKLKEISYIHAEGYAAGEMKHGPIALIDEHVPSVILNPRDAHFAKVRSNLAEIRARSGPVILVAEDGDQEAQEVSDLVLRIPAGCPNHLLALVMSVPMQLLAYFTADYKGTDVDQPRNLAKSVTVE